MIEKKPYKNVYMEIEKKFIKQYFVDVFKQNIQLSD